MGTTPNTAAICVRRSSADERDADDSDRSGRGLPGVGHIVQNPSVQGVRRLSGQARGSVTTIIAGNVFLRRPGP